MHVQHKWGMELQLTDTLGHMQEKEIDADSLQMDALATQMQRCVSGGQYLMGLASRAHVECVRRLIYAFSCAQA